MQHSRLAIVLLLAALQMVVGCRTNHGAPSEESTKQDDRDSVINGNRAIAPPPSTAMVMLDLETDRSWPMGRPQIIVHFHLNPSRSSAVHEVFLGYGGGPGDVNYRELPLWGGAQGKSHKLVIQYVPGQAQFKGNLGGRTFFFKGDDGDDDDSDWESSNPTVQLRSGGSWVELKLKRGQADMTLILNNAEL